MISIYDVLKASKGLPVRDPIACHWGRKLGGGAAGYDELTGTPPLTFVANGENLLDYRIYGANDGVGERTAQLYNKDATNPANGYIATAYLGSAGQTTITSDPLWSVSEYIPVDSSKTYTIVTGNASANLASVVEYDDNKTVVTGTAYARRASFQLTTNSQTKYLRISAYASNFGSQLVEGSTAPAQYIIYGYRINAEVGDGVTTTDTPIYIGDTPLASGEYVSYGEQKVYKYVGGELTPTDPPVALPALPTIDGATIVDFDNEPKPSEVYVKYPK